MGKGGVRGYALALFGNQTFQIRDDADPAAPSLLSGKLDDGFDIFSWHHANLTVGKLGTAVVITATVDGATLVNHGAGPTVGVGMVALGSGWHEAEFDNFQLEAVAGL